MTEVDDKRLLTELRSLRSYPPIALDDDAADELERRKLVTFVSRTTPDGTRRFALTPAGEKIAESGVFPPPPKLPRTR